MYALWVLCRVGPATATCTSTTLLSCDVTDSRCASVSASVLDLRTLDVVQSQAIIGHLYVDGPAVAAVSSLILSA